MEATTSNVIHRALERGHANHGWLDSYHTFSFASYYNPDSMHFGVLRVFNDDIVKGGEGFGRHPHDNMEIITIPVRGELEHADSMGHKQVLGPDEVQVMSAGTGLMHSEYNHNVDTVVNFFQLWIFPNKRNVEPRYDQKRFDAAGRRNLWQMILSPNGENDSLWIHQDAWLYRSSLDAGTTLEYTIRQPGNGVYLFVVEGQLSVNGQDLSRRDGIGVTDSSTLTIAAKSDAECIVLDVPLSLSTNAPRA